MSENIHKAPPGKYIVGEAFYGENEWAQVGDVHETLEAARTVAAELNAAQRPELQYFVYNENGLVSEAVSA